jgi:Glycosyltransferase
MVMSRKKVLFLSSWYPNRLDTHLGNFVQRHAEAVHLLNDVEVLYAIGVSGQKELFVVEDRLINKVRTVIIYYRKTFLPVFNFLRRKRAYRYGYELMSKPDIVHGNIMQTHVLFARELKEKYGIPYIITEHWSGLLETNYPSVSTAKKRVVKLIAEKADRLVPVSQALKKDMLAHGLDNDYEVVGNVVDTELFALKNVSGKKYFSILAHF